MPPSLADRERRAFSRREKPRTLCKNSVSCSTQRYLQLTRVLAQWDNERMTGRTQGPVLVAQLVHRPARKEFRLHLQVAPREGICREVLGKPYNVAMHVSAHIVR